jgi:hypothetical protein
MPLLNWVWPKRDSWHVAGNSDVNHTMHCMGVHNVMLAQRGAHDVGVPDMGMPLRGHALHGHAKRGRDWVTYNDFLN